MKSISATHNNKTHFTRNASSLYGAFFVFKEVTNTMKKNLFKRGMAGLLSLVMCLTALVGMKVVWWKCGAGHSYRAKITDRTIEQKGCPQCEAEFQQALPQMLIMMYGAQNGITVKSNSDSELGMRLVAYLPELHCAVDIAGATVTEKREQSVKAHICQSNRLGYYLIKRTANASQMAAEIKTLFIRNHIYLHTDSEKDVQVLRERFLEWKNRNACKLNGKY